MRLPSRSPGTLALACCLLAVATPAWAVVETWVSGTGTDSGSCPRATPCRTFAYAITKTNNGGTINVAEPGSFGPVTINKSVSIVADGVEALINTAANGAGIRIQAGPSHVVSLRGLTIEGVGDSNGITFISGAALHVQSSVVRGGFRGILFAPAAGTRELYVSDTLFANADVQGICLQPTGSAGVQAVFDRVHTERIGQAGLSVETGSTSGSITATMRNSTVSHSGAGLSLSGNDIQMMVDRSAFVNNDAEGVSVTGGANLRIGDSVMTGNGVGLNNASGTVASYETNKVDGNGFNTAGVITVINPR